jgi:hypothetical protein
VPPPRTSPTLSYTGIPALEKDLGKFIYPIAFHSVIWYNTAIFSREKIDKNKNKKKEKTK